MLSELIIMIPFYTLKITTRRVIDDQFLPNKKIKTASTVITTKYLFDLLLRFIHSATEIKLPADKKKQYPHLCIEITAAAFRVRRKLHKLGSIVLRVKFIYGVLASVIEFVWVVRRAAFDKVAFPH